jgi:hypothetical protein
LYNSLSDPDLTTVLATTNVIIETEEAYRFDGPSINTYTLDFSDINSTTIKQPMLIWKILLIFMKHLILLILVQI